MEAAAGVDASLIRSSAVHLRALDDASLGYRNDRTCHGNRP